MWITAEWVKAEVLQRPPGDDALVVPSSSAGLSEAQSGFLNAGGQGP